MDTFLTVVFWGVLALVVLGWIGSRPEPPRNRPSTGPTPTQPWSSKEPGSSATPQPRPDQARRPLARRPDAVDEAFVDGAIIGGALMWDHQQRRLVAREEELEALREERDAWEETAFLAGDDPDGDLAEFDAMGGFGVEPWAVDRYGPDPVDDLDVEDGGWDGFDDLDGFDDD